MGDTKRGKVPHKDPTSRIFWIKLKNKTQDLKGLAKENKDDPEKMRALTTGLGHLLNTLKFQLQQIRVNKKEIQP